MYALAFGPAFGFRQRADKVPDLGLAPVLLKDVSDRRVGGVVKLADGLAVADALRGLPRPLARCFFAVESSADALPLHANQGTDILAPQCRKSSSWGTSNPSAHTEMHCI